MTLEELYDILDGLRADWWVAYENSLDDVAAGLHAQIDAIGAQVVAKYGELSLIVYYQWA